jgi:hypothetical protein
MAAYIAYSNYYPVPINVNPLQFKTTVFGGATVGTHTLTDVYTYFGTNPLVKVMNIHQKAEIWGDPLAFPVVGYTQVTNVWGTTDMPTVRLKWDVFACGTDGSMGTFVGEVITPLRYTAAYNTRD